VRDARELVIPIDGEAGDALADETGCPGSLADAREQAMATRITAAANTRAMVSSSEVRDASLLSPGYPCVDAWINFTISPRSGVRRSARKEKIVLPSTNTSSTPGKAKLILGVRFNSLVISRLRRPASSRMPSQVKQRLISMVKTPAFQSCRETVDLVICDDDCGRRRGDADRNGGVAQRSSPRTLPAISWSEGWV